LSTRAKTTKNGMPIESIAWFWNPSRPGVKLGPEWFRTKLRELGDDLEVTWSDYHERWLVFMRKESVTHPIGMGWSLLMKVENDDGSYRPLDERVMARLYLASQKRWGSGLKYWEAVEAAEKRDKAEQAATDFDNTMQQAMESFHHSQISVAMRGKSNGSKFSTYQS
jgi:hypothetical protein